MDPGICSSNFQSPTSRVERRSAKRLTKALSFLSGDDWQLAPSSAERNERPGPANRQTGRRRLPVQRRSRLLRRGSRSAGPGDTGLPRRTLRGGQAPKTQDHLARRLAQRLRRGPGASSVDSSSVPRRPAVNSCGRCPTPESLRPVHGRCYSSPPDWPSRRATDRTSPSTSPRTGSSASTCRSRRPRFGSFSTRTTHPYFMATLASCHHRARDHQHHRQPLPLDDQRRDRGGQS